MGCGCGQKRRTTVYVLSFEDGSGRASSEHATRTDADVANARAGGGGTVRPVQR
ncbi:hypothetical protein Ait01nite_020140 [Actinoplanes italicus]|uniref:Uncharacterized protein n=1 Tax=Actinoplanes italicus TaxID=113567 RepID=A0A2T0KPC0_9ACTN|nr:hypothetical protein CLV67_101304 [Actinoplanes italicus]GIE28969.1 hypothetical protein Ait01nite_020140 [Actinoplanes italicus]